MAEVIHYIRGMKYQLVKDYSCQTPIIGVHIDDPFFRLDIGGLLYIRKGYAWDGASGPTWDSKSSMRASLVHDVFCSCMRGGRLDFDRWQDTVNLLFRQHCLEDGMWPVRADIWFAAVEFADAGNPDQGPDREVLTAP